MQTLNSKLWFKERFSWIMNNIEGQDDGSEQGCCEGARVPDYQENVEDEVQNKANVIIVTFKVIFLLNAMVKRKTCVFQTIKAENQKGSDARGRGGGGGGQGGGEGEENERVPV